MNQDLLRIPRGRVKRGWSGMSRSYVAEYKMATYRELGQAHEGHRILDATARFERELADGVILNVRDDLEIVWAEYARKAV